MAVGNQKQWGFLQKTVELGKIAHAYLFYGGKSSGKKKLAFDFVKLINCECAGKKPCLECRTCSEIEKNISPDLFFIEPDEGEIKIAAIRGLHSHLSLRSYSSPYKSVVIDRAHTLNAEAQSAFLKLLEEPKGRTIFILLTEYPETLLPTILSRVERIRIPSSVLASNADKDLQKKISAELAAISEKDLYWRFDYAKKLAESPEEIEEILAVWVPYFREQMLNCLSGGKSPYSLTQLSKILNSIQTTSLLLSTTNINARLALEILMLEL